MKKLIIWTIIQYQKLFSPDHSAQGKHRFPYGFCRYYPTCSEYSRQSIEEHGIVKGLMYGIWRILRCNPFVSGGYDPVPKSLYSQQHITDERVKIDA